MIVRMAVPKTTWTWCRDGSAQTRQSIQRIHVQRVNYSALKIKGTTSHWATIILYNVAGSFYQLSVGHGLVCLLRRHTGHHGSESFHHDEEATCNRVDHTKWATNVVCCGICGIRNIIFLYWKACADNINNHEMMFSNRKSCSVGWARVAGHVSKLGQMAFVWLPRTTLQYLLPASAHEWRSQVNQRFICIKKYAKIHICPGIQ